MPTFRILGPLNGQATINVNGRSYSGAPGTIADIVDADAMILDGAGWTRVCFSGPTSGRPTISLSNGNYFAASRGFSYLDTTISAIVVWDGATWRNPITGASA